MPVWRAAAMVSGFTLLNLNVTTCRSNTDAETVPSAQPEPMSVELKEVDTSALTQREKKDWSAQMSSLLAPCPDTPVNLNQCISEKRDCDACLPAANFLVTRVRRGEPASQVEATFTARFSPDAIKTVDAGSSPSIGPKAAPVQIVEWADFECPFCSMAGPVLKAVVKRYAPHVRLTYKHYPLSMHEHAEPAARAAVAAGLQGKFWEMHQVLFGNQAAGFEQKQLLELAGGLGLDTKQFLEDLGSENVADVVFADKKHADALELSGTPLIYINGRHFGLEDFDLREDLEDWVRLEIELRTGKAPQPVDARAPSAAVPSAAVPSAAPAASAKPASSAH